MYDFKYKNINEIKKNINDYLIFVKRLLPRWANGMPDSEVLTLFESLKKIKQKPIIVETGIGASTLAFVLMSILKNGKVFSWDTNGSKGFFLNSVMNESIGKTFGVNINKYWTFIASSSTSKYTGIEILKEKKLKSNFCFLDSYHTWETVEGELNQFLKVADKKFILGLDDAYYTYKKFNLPMINMIRSKLNLKTVKHIQDNKCDTFYNETKRLLKEKNFKFTPIKNNFDKLIKKDIFLRYYSGDRTFMNKLGMEDKKKLNFRIKLLKVTK